jgi:hypothetical protein
MLRFSIAASALALVFSSPILAAPIAPIAALPTDIIRVVCAEGSPNCQKLDQGHIKAGNLVQEDLKNHGEVDCQGGGICGNAASGGAAAATAKGGPKLVAPRPLTQTVTPKK